MLNVPHIVAKKDPECNFRGRIINYHSSDGKGIIAIIREHASKCKYLSGNETSYRKET